MLAYVFWHWPQAGHAAAEYEQLQRNFHDALAQTNVAGFQRSFVFRLTGSTPWLGATPAYADWYLVDGFAALDALNVAAISGPCEQPHAAVARAMGGGAGSLFGLRGDVAPGVAGARYATWLTKPRSMTYDTFYGTVAGLASSQESSLWRRQMVLGPTPEFGLLTPEPLVFDRIFQPLSLELSPIWEQD
ncbi:MAG TPA: hypothetical protein VGQ62_06050 [Chloroflexota bacterium]|jgi:hypothetical protein|nr:hypothetical protein [Chloroflexota bacterium]